MKGFQFLGVERNRGALRKPTKAGIEWTYNHWLAALVKGKCSSTKPTSYIYNVDWNYLIEVVSTLVGGLNFIKWSDRLHIYRKHRPSLTHTTACCVQDMLCQTCCGKMLCASTRRQQTQCCHVGYGSHLQFISVDGNNALLLGHSNIRVSGLAPLKS